jgi:hypothetical protein
MAVYLNFWQEWNLPRWIIYEEKEKTYEKNLYPGYQCTAP